MEYLPAAHWPHAVAPALLPVFVIEPAGHSSHPFAASKPVVPLYLPTPQSVHLLTFEAVEYLPAAHAMHVVAPVLVPVLVIEPAGQSVHDTTVEAVEYLPTAQAVHVFAPTLVPVSVIEPAAHSEQYDLPPSG